MDYFQIRTMGNEEMVVFRGNPIPCCESPVFNIFRELCMTPRYFADKANELFSRYHIRVPDDYPSQGTSKKSLKSRTVISIPWDEFTICVGCSILIDQKFNKDIGRILKNELVTANSYGNILHVSALSAIVLYYLKNEFNVDIPKEQKNKYNPDMIINGLNCEVKVVEESDWTLDINPRTGQGKNRILSEDIAYDIGKFISNRACEGIKQGDVILADLSLKSFDMIRENGWITKNRPGLADLQKYRIIYFAREIIYFDSFFIDFDPRLWQLIKASKDRYRFGISPPPLGCSPK